MDTFDPPQHLADEMNNFVQHNITHPDNKIGATQIAAWLGRNKFEASRHQVHRWLKKATAQQLQSKKKSNRTKEKR